MTWEYATVFVLAATPLVELLVVIPLGIGYGLHPATVALLTFAGNALPVILIAAAWERIAEWRARRAAHRAGTAPEQGAGVQSPGDGNDGVEAAPDAAPEAAPEAGTLTARSSRARRIWSRYGLPGLALLAPMVTGVHIAAVAALALGSTRRGVTLWLLLSIACWTVGVTLVTVVGVAGIRQLL